MMLLIDTLVTSGNASTIDAGLSFQLVGRGLIDLCAMVRHE
jgi:hypothetical protein